MSVPAVKIFADGVIESGTAALVAPYVGRGDDGGGLNFTPERFAALATAADKSGFQIHVHAIGDGAIRVTLDALEAAQQANRRRDSRHHGAHLERVAPADFPRFARVSVLANIQPLWAYGDRDLFAVAPEEIHTVKVLPTLLEGRETFRAAGF